MRMQDATSYNWFCSAHPERHAALLARIERARQRLEKEYERLHRACRASYERMDRAYDKAWSRGAGDSWSLCKYDRALKRADRTWLRADAADPDKHMDALSLRYFMEEVGRACKSG